MLKITGYSSSFSVRPGDDLDFYVHCLNGKEYQTDIVRLIHGDTNPVGPGFKEELVNTPINGLYKGREQKTYSGSYAIVPSVDYFGDVSITIAALIYSTTPDKGEQGIVTKFLQEHSSGIGLFINNDSESELRIGVGNKLYAVSSGKKILPRVWYFVAASFDIINGQLSIIQKPCITPSNGGNGPRIIPPDQHSVGSRNSDTPKNLSIDCNAPLLIGASTQTANSNRKFCSSDYVNLEENISLPEQINNFNGKIERPLVSLTTLDFNRAEELCINSSAISNEDFLLGLWDFSANISPDASSCKIVDIGPNENVGILVNLPYRGVTGQHWSDSMSYVSSPDQYGAIHFHDDDIDDSRWEVDFSLKIPEDLKSGCYAARLRVSGKSDSEHEDYIPFFVRPAAGAKPAPIALIIPTASYMAYANDNLNMESPIAQLITGRVTSLQPSDLLFNEIHKIGYGLYGTHNDGSGISISTRLRPILNMRPKYKHFLSPSVRQYNADLHLVDWLTEKGYSFDVHTDADVDTEGSNLLNKYKIILTGSHPEYQTEKTLNAYHDYQDQGGRMLYLGGNGFYWVTNYHSNSKNIIEVRRGDNGTRAWTIAPGEYCNMFDGKHGGIWRVRGRSMAKLVGVSFTAFGLDVCSYYKKAPDSENESCAWIFKGIKEDILGDFGLVGGGAAGFEMDRYDPSLGTPENTFLLASSEGHTDMYMCVTEEVSFNFRGYYGSGGGGDQNPLIRADMVYFKTPREGAVFSVGSIAYCGSLSHNNYDNNISTLTANVIDGFLSPGPLP